MVVILPNLRFIGITSSKEHVWKLRKLLSVFVVLVFHFERPYVLKHESTKLL